MGRNEKQAAEEARLHEWQSQFGAIRDQAAALIVNHHIFREVKDIIANSPVARQPSSFHSWLGRIYAQSALISVRRLIGKRKDEVSLRRLLEDIRRHRTLISRERHIAMWVKQYGDNPEWTDMGNADFDHQCGEGESCPRRRDIDEDLGSLGTATAKIKAYADERVAHYAAEGPGDVPTYGQLEKAITCIDKIISKYGTLLNGSEAPTQLPVWQYDWKTIFQAAWLPGDVEGDDAEGHPDG